MEQEKTEDGGSEIEFSVVLSRKQAIALLSALMSKERELRKWYVKSVDDASKDPEDLEYIRERANMLGALQKHIVEAYYAAGKNK